MSGHWDDASGHCRHKGTSVSYLDDRRRGYLDDRRMEQQERSGLS
ncbi:MAG: hypothetical protein ACEY3L_13780 [Wolbachia sp.]